MQVGNGLELDAINGLTTRFKSPNLITKKENGLYIPQTDTLSGKIDNYTVIPFSKDSKGNTILGVNREVVCNVFSMCVYPVTNRGPLNGKSAKESYTVDNTKIKTVDDIRSELNAVLDAYGESGIPLGMPRTQYYLKPGDLFQFRRKFFATQISNGSETWPVAVDDCNRYPGVPICAFFYVNECERDAESRTLKLVLTCLWADTKVITNNEYKVGSTYTSTAIGYDS